MMLFTANIKPQHGENSIEIKTKDAVRLSDSNITKRYIIYSYAPDSSETSKTILMT